jgi:hypothetical protein
MVYYTTISTNFNNLAAARNECSCSSLNIVLTATPSKTLASLPKLFPRMVSLRAQMRFKHDRARYWLYVGWGRTAHSRFFYCFLCFQTCVCSCLFMLKKDFCDILMRSNSLETLLQVLRVWIHRCELNGLTKWIILRKLQLPQPAPPKKNSDHNFLCWRGRIKLLLPRRIWMMPFHWPSFCLRFIVIDPFWCMYRANCTVYYPDQQIHYIYIYMYINNILYTVSTARCFDGPASSSGSRIL